MRFLANENFPGDAVVALREAGHDVAWIRTDAPGAPDIEVLAIAQQEERVLITFDKGFGELAFRSHLSASSGIILFRISAPSSVHVAKAAVAALKVRENWTGHFSVIEDRRVRIKPLPSVNR
jgi:predicted nuclease of predicted toxin-antitoxin system